MPQEDLNSIRHVQPNDPVAANVTAQPTRALEARLQQLESYFTAQANNGQATLLTKVSIGTSVSQYDAVYYNPTTQTYEQALASVTAYGDTFVRNPQSYVQGIVWNVYNGGTADILIGGYSILPVATINNVVSIMGQMLEVGQTFAAGSIYYLSANYPGKLTQYPPPFQVQVLLTDNTYLFVRTVYSNPEAVENYYRNDMGMRPVGGLRQTPKGQSRFQIVGFDALEAFANSGNTYYRPTTQTTIATIQQFGYMLADVYPTTANSEVISVPANPFFIQVSIPTSGNITLTSDATLADLTSASPTAMFNTVSLAFPGSSAAAGGPTGSPLNYTVLDVSGAPLAILKFNFTSLDRSFAREVYFRFPISFQGWKMVNPPTVPAGTAKLVNGGVGGVIMTNSGTGYLTPPRVVFTGGGGSGAVGAALINSLGVVTGVQMTNNGTGYTSAPTVAFVSTTDSATTTVVNPGQGYLQPPSVVLSSPDFPPGITATATATLGAGYSVSGTVIVNGGTNYSQAIPPVVAFSAAPAGGTTATGVAHVNNSGIVDYVTVTNSGNGYTQIPTLSIAPPGTTATATCTISTGSINTVTITAPGLGYSSASPPIVVFNGGGFVVQAVGTATVSVGGQITGIVFNQPGNTVGSGYTSAPTIVIAAPGIGAAALATIGSAPGISSTISITNPGTGYTPTPTASFSGSPSIAASAIISVNAAGQVNGVYLLNGGAGYASTPTLTITDPNGVGTGATATCIMSGETVASITLTAAGSGYTPPPYVAILTTSGGGATAFATVSSGGQLSYVYVLNCGINYLSVPVVSIAAPGTASATATLTPPALQGINRVASGTGYAGSLGVVVESPLSTVNPVSATASCVVTTNAVIYIGPLDSSGNPTFKTVGGSNLTVAPTVVISAPNAGVQAQAIAVISSGTIIEVVITQGGSGYVTPPSVTFLSNEPASNVGYTLPNYYSILSVGVANAGSGYSSTNPPSSTNGGILISGNLIANGVPAVLTAQIVGGEVASILVTSSGYGYTSTPTVVFATGGATVHSVSVVLNPAVIAGAGHLDGFKVVSGGNSYTIESVLTDVSILAGGVGISQTATVYGSDPSNFIITDIPVLNGSYGSGGTVQALVVNNTVVRIAIENRGSGYSSDAPITLSWPSTGLNTTAAAYTLQSGNLTSTVLQSGSFTPTGAGYDPLNPPSTANGGIVITVGTGAVVTATVSNAGQLTGWHVTGSGGAGYTTASIMSFTPAANPCRTQVTTHPSPLIGVTNGTGSSAGGFYTVSGGQVTAINILSGGSGFTRPPILVFGGVALGDTLGGTWGITVPAVAYCAIINGSIPVGSLVSTSNANTAYTAGNFVNPGAGYPSSGTFQLGFLDGGQVDLTANTASGVSGLVFTNPGKGYLQPPIATLVGGGILDAGYPTAPGAPVEMPATVQVGLDGQGGWLNPNPMTIGSAAGYAADFPANPGLPQVIPAGMEFYYNIKADPTLYAKWPSLPVDKTTFLQNGVEMRGGVMSELTGVVPYGADVAFSQETILWSSAHPDGAPWDRGYQQLFKSGNPQFLSGGWDNVLNNTADSGSFYNWLWWENTSIAEPNLSKAWIYINRLSRYATSTKVSSLTAFSPIRVINLDSGIDSTDSGVPMGGRLAIQLDGIFAASSTPSTQINLVTASGAQVIWQNTSNTSVCISSVILKCVVQQTTNNVSVLPSQAALVSMGTASGNYQDIIGQPVNGASQGVNCCLVAQGQCKELFVDAGLATPVLNPGDSLYLLVQTPALSPIITQLVVAYVKAQALS